MKIVRRQKGTRQFFGGLTKIRRFGNPHCQVPQRKFVATPLHRVCAY